MGAELAGRNGWATRCAPTRGGIDDALGRIHRGERRTRWQRLLDRLREVLA